VRGTPELSSLVTDFLAEARRGKRGVRVIVDVDVDVDVGVDGDGDGDDQRRRGLRAATA